MTSYLDDTWLQAEMQRFEDTKQALQAAATLLERATAAAPQLQRGLERLDSHEKKTRQSLDQLTSEKRQELASVVQQAQAEFDSHVREVIRQLSAMGEAGQLLELRREVSGLLRAFPGLEQQAARLGEDLMGVQVHYPALLTQLDGQVAALQGRQDRSEAQLSELSLTQERHLAHLNQLSGQGTEFGATLEAAQANLAEVQKGQQQFRTSLQSQAVTIERAAQQLGELEHGERRRYAELSASLGTSSRQISSLGELLNRLESRQTLAESRMAQLDARVSEQIKASQQLQEKLLGHLTAWREESQQTHQQLSRRVEQLAALPPQVVTLNRALEETRSQLDAHRKEAAGQRDALADLDNRVGTVQTRATRFIAWFEKAGALARLRGTPE